MEFRDKVSNQLANQAPSKNPQKAVQTSTLTASNGAPVDSLTASQTAGPRGPITLQDFTLIDHLAAFDREVYLFFSVLIFSNLIFTCPSKNK